MAIGEYHDASVAMTRFVDAFEAAELGIGLVHAGPGPPATAAPETVDLWHRVGDQEAIGRGND